MSTEQPIGNFTILERIKYDHLPFPSREELLDFMHGIDELIQTELYDVPNSILLTSRNIQTKQDQIHKEIQDVKDLIVKLLGDRDG